MGVILVFIRFSIIHQLLTDVVHVNLYLLYLFGIPTLLGVALCGGVQRTLRGRPAVFWGLFVVWLTVGLPFSSWKGGSIGTLNAFIRTDFPMLFVIAGLTVTWRECQAMMRAIACGALVIMSASKLFHTDNAVFGERLALSSGTIANSNDYACHLVLVMPFLIWAGLTAKHKAIRLGAWGGIGWGVVLVLQTASRGALIAMGAGALYWLLRGTMRQRVGLLAAGPVAAAALITFVPQSSLTRIVSFSMDESRATEDAVESSFMRKYLLEQSIKYTLEHPVFGVGLAQFSEYEGQHNVLAGFTHGYWHETHNTYTQVSSECGIPALALYIAGIVSTFFLLDGAFRRARGRPECEDIKTATFCIMLAMVMYCTAITFVNFAYFFYLPAMSSLVIAVSRAAEAEFKSRPSTTPAAPLAGFAPPRRRPAMATAR
jgi:O-antigen ligase